MLWIYLTPGLLFAGNGPHNWLVVYDPGDPHGVAIARFYQQARGFPDRNLVAYSFPRRAAGSPSLNHVITAAECWAFIGSLRATITARGLDGQIHGITLVGNAPNSVTTSSPSSTASINSALFFAPGTTTQAQWEARTDDYSKVFRGHEVAGVTVGQPATEIRSDLAFTGERYWLATHLGFVGIHGLRPDEVFTLIDRSSGCDGTAPKGTIYWPLNGDIRSTTRASQAAYLEPEWKSLGLDYHIYGQSYGGGGYEVPRGKTGAPGSIPVSSRAVQGAICGTWVFELDSQPNLFTPGAIAEQMTSYGGMMGDTLRWTQSECTLWLRAGAAGTSGTVTEPYAVQRKFPNARIHSHYFNGATLAEAFFTSLQQPWQTLVMGDGLTQPYAKIPALILSGIAEGAAVSGTVTLGATATGAAGVEAALDLAIDGRIIKIGNPVESVVATRVPGGFQINTTTLSEGWHELRVIAYAANAVRSQGFATRTITVNNSGGSVTITGPVAGTWGMDIPLTVNTTGVSGITSVEVRALGQVLATLGASGGTANIPASKLSYHTATPVFAVAKTASGKEISSAPHEITAAWTAMSALPEEATLPGVVAVARIFTNNVTAAGFNWTTTTPVAVLPVKDRFALTVDHPTQWPMMSDPTGKTGGIEFATRFYAREDGVYDFALEGWSAMGMAIDGVDLTGGVVGGTIVQTSAALAAGWHEVRIRAALPSGAPWWLKPIAATFRAPYSRRFHFMGWPVKDFEYFSLDHCAAPVSALDVPRLAGRATAPGEAVLTRSGLPSATGWTIQRHTSQPAVSVLSYSGNSTSPSLVGPDNPDAMRPGARTANDGTNAFTLVPPWLHGGLRLLTAKADRAAGGSALIYQVQVPAWVSVYAVVNLGNNGLPAWMTAQSGWVKVSAWDVPPSEGLNVESSTTSAWQVWKKTIKQATTLSLGSGGVSDAISFVFIKDFHEPIYSLLSYSGANTAPVIVGRNHANAMAVGASCANDNTNKFTALLPWLEGGSRMIVAAADQSLGESALPYKVQLPAGTTVYAVINGRLDAYSRPIRPAWMTTQGGWSLAADSGVTSTTASQWQVWKKLITVNTALDLGLSGGASGAEATTFVFNKDVRYWDECWEQVATAAAGATSATVSGLDAGAQALRVVASGAPALTVPSNEIVLDLSTASSNGAPVVQAGMDLQVAGTTTAVSLNGVAQDDDLPPILTTEWSKESGPGEVNFAHPLSASTTATFSAPGVYKLRLTASDGVRSSADSVLVTITGAAASNAAPIVNAGGDQTLLETQSVTLNGSATDDGLPNPPGRLTYRWRQLSGPSIVTFYDCDKPDTLAYFSAPGAYQLELSVSDGAKTGTDTVDYNVSSNPNNAPTVSVPSNSQNAAIGIPFTLSATISDDGLPTPPGALTIQWSKVLGPYNANATLSSTTTAATVATFSDIGEYVMRINAFDGERTSGQSITVTVGPNPAGNLPPVLDLDLAASVETLVSDTVLVPFTASDDGKPNPPSVMTLTWEKVSGPGAAAGENYGTVADNNLKGALTFDEPGEYEMKLTASDTVATTSKNATVTVHGIRHRQVWAWGRNRSGQLGPFEYGLALSRPYQIGRGWSGAVMGEQTSLALGRGGQLLAAGSNSYGVLNPTDTPNQRYFSSLHGLANLRSVAFSGETVAVVKGDGTVWTWGGAYYGQLGDGSALDRTTPAQVPGLSNIGSVRSSASCFLAVEGAGSVFGWGYNQYGQLGVGNKTQTGTPTQAVGISGVRETALGRMHSLFLKSDGTVWATGRNADGQLGDGTVLERLTPVQVLKGPSPGTPLTGIRKVTAGYAFSLALDDQGHVWAWGDNSNGTLGNNGTTDSSWAARVKDTSDLAGLLTGVTDIACSNYSAYAVKSGGELVAWGAGSYNAFGEGQGTATRTLPGSVGGLPPVSSVWAGGSGAFAATSWASYEDFVAEHFTPQEIAAGRADPMVDFLNAGKSNLSVYASGGDPKSPTQSFLTGARMEDGQIVFEAEYLATAKDLEIRFEQSTDLSIWDAAAPTSTEYLDMGDMERATLRYNLRDSRLFLRMVRELK